MEIFVETVAERCFQQKYNRNFCLPDVFLRSTVDDMPPANETPLAHTAY